MPRDTERKSSAAKIAANARYNEKNVIQVKFGFNKKTDSDIIEHLQKQENKQKYIKTLIRNDIKKEVKQNET